MRVFFRADASTEIGTGHVMRCLTLADALRTQGAACSFICRTHPGNLIALIRQRGFDVHELPFDANWSVSGYPTHHPAHAAWLGADQATDAAQTIVGAGKTEADWLIVDHYAIDARWQQVLRSAFRHIMVIDDLADRPHDCELLLDQNLVADMHCRYDGRLATTCTRLLGPKYALLQPAYAELRERTPARSGLLRRILVFFGGADNHNLTGRALAAFHALGRSDIHLDVVIGSDHSQASALKEIAQASPNITLHQTLPSLAPLMAQADLAIGAVGATSWERCCLGLPALVITLAENQRSIAAELHRQGLIRWLGHHDAVDVAILYGALSDCLANDTLSAWSQRCWEIVDGRGTARVLQALCQPDNGIPR
jgi:UDP-2,4-diacetamido-2,4,6-trideoxy-beta-L-altropyranose hydrolase